MFKAINLNADNDFIKYYISTSGDRYFNWQRYGCVESRPILDFRSEFVTKNMNIMHGIDTIGIE